MAVIFFEVSNCQPNYPPFRSSGIQVESNGKRLVQGYYYYY